ncbi:hypothetical protein CLV28_0937 [Sediminihabitans luteus]|uniref:Lipoprotein n=1 Tax=Sediminihabitans luteus TaxID=1138585 RepID=A0A2M9D0I9_9CELL|nr:hypothetical protein [Sediminihabitans luteus]PJJ77711.1 hypothetical protein CLV28_0937 [Sediminihabitans luteus]GIJ00062.1 hypothetical protein Slu03_24390 [Sediminihabitans luteus]
MRGNDVGRRSVVGVLVGVGVVGLSACGPPEEWSWDRDPEPAVTPSIVWSDGEPTSDLEADPWVQAVRAGLVPYAVAYDSRDLRSDSLHETWTPNGIAQMRKDIASFAGEDDWWRMPGPFPFDPLTVEVVQDGASATVQGCTLEPWWYGRLDPWERQERQVSPSTMRFEVVKTDPGGYLVDSVEPIGVPCESDHMTAGVFDPLPDGSWEFESGQVFTRDATADADS